MVNIKLTVNIELPGSTMVEESVCQSDKNMSEKHKLVFRNRKNAKETETLEFTTRKCKPATQVINMSEEAYTYMVSNEIPDFSNRSTWLKMSRKQRLEAHLTRTAEHLGGKLSKYEVFPD